MTEYALYIESGPRRRKTMVHVPDLLGCIAQGPTTEAALEATPEAIRNFLRFLRKHGETVDPQASFTTALAAHVMQGNWLGNGDPTPGFSPDFRPLEAGELDTCLRHLDWLVADLSVLVSTIPPAQWSAEPAGGGRSIGHIYKHIAGAHGEYLRYLVGKVNGLPEALRSVEEADQQTLPPGLARLWQISRSRLEVLTDAERRDFVQHGQVTWSARRAIRRMLEHGWEHLMEVSSRLKGTPG